MDERALQTQMRTVLAQLELCSSAPTAAYDPTGRGDDTTGDVPAVSAPHLRYRWRLAGVDDGLQRRLDAAEAQGDHNQREAERTRAHDWAHTARLGILKAARAELAHITGRTGEAPARRVAKLDTAKGIESVIREEAPGKPSKIVAERLDISIFIVNRIYAELGLDPFDGSHVTSVETDLVARVRRLKDSGHTQTQIAAICKVSQPTVHRYLRKTAA